MREETSDGFSAIRLKPPSREQPRMDTRAHEWPGPSVGSCWPARLEKEVAEATETKLRVSHVFPALAPPAPLRGQLRAWPPRDAKARTHLSGCGGSIFSPSSACSAPALRRLDDGGGQAALFRVFRGAHDFLATDFQRSQREINPAIGWPACGLHPREARPRQSRRFPGGSPHGRAPVRDDGSVFPGRPTFMAKKPYVAGGSIAQSQKNALVLRATARGDVIA